MNINVINKLPQVNRQKGTYAVLARLDGKSLFTFLTMPTEITYGKASNYVTANTQNAIPFLQFTGQSNPTLTINNLPLSTIDSDKSLVKYVEDFERLAEPDPIAFSPPALVFRWAQRLFSPCLLSGSITRKENMWTGSGDLLSCNLSFTLIQVPENQLINL